jgi:hypothetical protein
MKNADIYIVSSWCRSGILIFLFDADHEEKDAFNLIISEMKKAKLYRSYFIFCLQEFKTLIDSSETLRIGHQRYQDNEITITKLPVRIPKDDQVLSFAFIDTGTKYWDFKKEEEKKENG